MKNSIQEFISAYEKECLPVYLYGCGAGVIWYIKFMKIHDIPISGIIDGKLMDNKEYKLHGMKVSSLSHVLQTSNNVHIIISAPAHRKTIRNKLMNMKFPERYIYTFDPTVDVQQGNTAMERQKYFKRHANELKKLYNDLADEKSRLVLRQVIKGSLENNCDCYEEIAGESQYFPDFIVRNLSKEEVFLDAGAYTGDTIREFIAIVHNDYKKIYAFEPDKNNMAIARKQLNDDRIVYYESGVGSREETLCFINENGEGSDEGAHVVDIASFYTDLIKTVRIDDVIKDKVSYIKMDIEGMELQALKGGQRIIQTYRPMLAISVYHKTEDIVEISKYINELNSGYKLYLRHFWAHNGTDTVLFAICNNGFGNK